MSDSRSRPTRRPTNGARRQTVGGAGRNNHLPAIFIGALVAVVLAFVILLTVAADAFSNDDPPPLAPGATPTETATSEAAASAAPTSPSAVQPTVAPTVGADGSIVVVCNDILAPLDKQHRLERNCVPNDLQQLPAEFSSGVQRMTGESRAALLEMFAAAKLAGFALYANSTYRSYDEQAATFQFWVNTSGLEYAQRTSARAGHSEHQLGTTADVAAGGKELEAFSGTPEAAWVAANAHRFGFIVSYPDGKEAITGYAYEPWHVRYVGKAVAQQVKDSGLTLHQYLLR